MQSVVDIYESSKSLFPGTEFKFQTIAIMKIVGNHYHTPPLPSPLKKVKMKWYSINQNK